MFLILIFWAVVELLLLGAFGLFVLRVRAVWQVLQGMEKRYALAPETIPAGHTVRKTRTEIRPALPYRVFLLDSHHGSHRLCGY